jgi:hypothetical protein
LSGADAGNYTFGPTGSLNASPTLTTSVTASITPASLTVSGFTAASKVYDATTTASVSGGTLLGTLAGDSVALSGSSGSFADKNVGTAKTVTVSAGALSGTDAGNYLLASNTVTTTADITARGLTVAGLSVSDKVYDGTTAASLSGLAGALQGVLSGDTVTLNPGSASATFSDKNVGQTKSVNLAGLSLSGTDSGNYGLSIPTDLRATITPATLSVSGLSVADKVYDGTVQARLTGVSTLNGVLGQDNVSLNLQDASAVFLDRNAGAAKPVTLGALALAGSDARNYTLTTPTGLSATISPRALGLAFSSPSKTYDGTTTATITAQDDRVTGDALTLAFTAAFADRNAGTAKPVAISSITLAGEDASNYTVPSSASAIGTITQRALATWTATASGNWSSAANWDALPDGNNVAAVALPAGAQVTYDLSGLNLQSLTNAGSLLVSGSGLKLAALTNTGTLTVASALDLSGLEVGGAGRMVNQGQLTLAGTTLASALANSGTVLASGSNTLASVANSGTFNVATGSTRVTGGFTQTGGTTTLGAPGSGASLSAATSLTGGRLQGAGSVGGNLNVSNAVLAPGFSPGALSIEGDLSLGAGSTLLMELGGTDPASYDRILAAGNLQLGGDLIVTSDNGFRAAAGQTFQLFTVQGSVSGSLGSVSTSGGNLEALQLSSLVVSSASGSTTIPAITSSLYLPALETQILNAVVPTPSNSTSSSSTSPDVIRSVLASTSLPGSAIKSMVPPPYVPPPPPPPPPAQAPISTPIPFTAPPAPTAVDSSDSGSPSPASSPTPAPAPAPAAAPNPAPKEAASTPTPTPSSAPPPPLPVVRSSVKSLELDPAAPASTPTTTSRKETAEVSYAKPAANDDKDKGKGC